MNGWRWVLISAVLGLAPAGCKKESPPKAGKKISAAVAASKEREALNALSALMRGMEEWPVASGAAPGVRAAAFLERVRAVEADGLPENLRGPWRELRSALEGLSGVSGREIPEGLRRRAVEAAADCNAALAADGITDFRF